MIAQTTKICIYAFDFPIGLDVNLASALVILEATYLFIVLILININKRNKFSFVTRTVLVCYTMYLFPPLPKKKLIVTQICYTAKRYTNRSC